MKEILVDFSDPFVRNVAEGLNISTEDDYITSEEWIALQGNISCCVISYQFAKIHFLFIKDALEKKQGHNGNYKRLNDKEVVEYIECVKKEKDITGTISLKNAITPDLRFTEENYNEYRECIQKIDSEFENHQEVIQAVTLKPIWYLEEELSVRKAVGDYRNLNYHLTEVSDYKRLQDVGIESYLHARRGCIRENGLTVENNCKKR